MKSCCSFAFCLCTSSGDTSTELESPVDEPSHVVVRDLGQPRRPFGEISILRTASRSEASTPRPLGSARESVVDRDTHEAQLEYVRMRLEEFVLAKTPLSSTISMVSSSGECSSPPEASTSQSESLLHEPSHLVVRDLAQPRRPLGELTMMRPASRSEASTSRSSGSTRESAPNECTEEVQQELHEPSHLVVRDLGHPRRPLGELTIFRPSSRSETSTSLSSRSTRESDLHEQSHVIVRDFGHPRRPLEELMISRSAASSEGSTPLHFDSDRESSPERSTQQAQLEFTRMRLQGFIVTETPLPSTVCRANSSGECSPPPEASLPRLVRMSRKSVLEEDRIRESHFALALARMEGRVAPSSLSPIQRYVHPEGRYSDEVVLEHHGLVLVCPRPVSRTKKMMIRRLLRDTDYGSDDFALYESSADVYLYERPGNPTPERAIFHNDELEVMGFVEKASDW